MTGQAGRAGALARANLRRLGGDRRAAFGGLLLPVLIMLLVGTIFGGSAKRLAVGVVDGDHSALSARALVLLARSDRLHLRPYSSSGQEAGALRRGLVQASILFPPGYGASLQGGGTASVALLFNPGQVQSEEAREDLVVVENQAQDEASAARYAEAHSGVPIAVGLRRAEAIDDAGYRASLRRPKPVLPSPYSYTAPSNLVLFTFIMAMAVSSGFVQSRRLGVIRRILSTPTSALTVMAGESIGILIVAVSQSLFLLFVGAVVLRVGWGDPVAVALVIAFQSLAATGAGLLVGTLARSEEQALAVAIPVGIAAGMLGGCMWSLDIVGPTMRSFGHVVPQAWSMDALVALASHHAGLGAVAGDLVALAFFAVALGGAGVLSLRRVVASGR